MKLLYGVLLLLGLYFVYHFDYERYYLANILDKTSSELNMRIRGLGESVDNQDRYRFISVSFEKFKPLTQDEIRELLIKSVNTFLKNINTNEKFKKYLSHYPFKIEDIEVAIYMREENGDTLYDPFISVAYIEGRNITYMTNDPEKSAGAKQTIREKYNDELQ